MRQQHSDVMRAGTEAAPEMGNGAKADLGGATGRLTESLVHLLCEGLFLDLDVNFYTKCLFCFFRAPLLFLIKYWNSLISSTCCSNK